MASKTIVILEDDLGDGAADETVTFSLDGASYEIDLSRHNAQALRDSIASYTAAGRRTGGHGQRRSTSTGPTRPARTDREQLDAMRRWARENGYEVSNRGRISKAVREAYDAAR